MSEGWSGLRESNGQNGAMFIGINAGHLKMLPSRLPSQSAGLSGAVPSVGMPIGVPRNQTHPFASNVARVSAIEEAHSLEMMYTMSPRTTTAMKMTSSAR